MFWQKFDSLDYLRRIVGHIALQLFLLLYLFSLEKLILINELLQNNYRHAASEKVFEQQSIVRYKNDSNKHWKGILERYADVMQAVRRKMVIIHYENNRIFREIIYGQVYQGIEVEMSAYFKRFITILYEISKKNFECTIIHSFTSYSIFEVSKWLDIIVWLKRL